SETPCSRPHRNGGQSIRRRHRTCSCRPRDEYCANDRSVKKEENIWVVGADERQSEDYRTLDGRSALAIVIGNEGKGISRIVKEKCDWFVHIPMQGEVPSLNASVAASILMYEIYRKRNPLGE